MLRFAIEPLWPLGFVDFPLCCSRYDGHLASAMISHNFRCYTNLLEPLFATLIVQLRHLCQASFHLSHLFRGDRGPLCRLWRPWRAIVRRSGLWLDLVLLTLLHVWRWHLLIGLLCELVLGLKLSSSEKLSLIRVRRSHSLLSHLLSHMQLLLHLLLSQLLLTRHHPLGILHAHLWLLHLLLHLLLLMLWMLLLLMLLLLLLMLLLLGVRLLRM